MTQEDPALKKTSSASYKYKEWYKDKAGRKEICLYDLDQLALILLEPSGVFYFNQVGGHSCYQNFVEGIFSFVSDPVKKLHNIIAEYMLYKNGLAVEDADFLDKQFEQFDEVKYLRVDRTRLGDSVEAWVYVDIDQALVGEPKDYSEYYNMAFKGFGCTKGLLTWDNSD
jgi:hypothetical protein